MHVIIAVFVAWLFNVNPFLAALGAILPDCDTRKSMIGKFIPFWILVKHRSVLTHSIIPVIIASYLTLAYNVGWGFVIGYMSHILADSFTKDGVPMWGIPGKNFRYFGLIPA